LRTFTFQGETYRYFYHKYNTTWRNERAVEIPIVWKIVKKYMDRNILEVGNVLSHYFSVNHDILDKYEKAKGVINQDVVNFSTAKKYDLIVCISTLEHVGWDETPREHMKILHAIENLKKLLAPKGKIVITLPLGYNPELDKLLKNGKIHFTKRFCMRRNFGG
jgi:SAM-dependent methyltransferase